MKNVNLFPNVIVFHHNDGDGICAAFTIKLKYDNNLLNDKWERNVTCISCNYNENFNLDFFKSKTTENIDLDCKENIIYMVDYGIQPNNLMKEFYDWTVENNYKFFWVDHHITAIDNLKHFNLPGYQSTSKCGCVNTWNFIMKNKKEPLILQYINDFDIWNKKTKFNWDKEIIPFTYYISSLGANLNDNTSKLVSELKLLFENDKLIEEKLILGNAINDYLINNFVSNIKKMYELTWNEYKCLVINSSEHGSMQFEVNKNYKKYDLLITWSYDGNNYLYGIYSTNPKIHVGDICKKYLNGGGHKGAGGGRSKHLIFLN